MQPCVALLASVFMIVWSSSEGAFITPNAYTLPGVMAVNGSSANGGCPSSCVGDSPSPSGMISSCDCEAFSMTGETTTGVLIDGVIPTSLDTAERNTAGDLVWAAPLFTVRRSTGSVVLGFMFPASVVLQEVELYLFNCPAWDIGAQTIRIRISGAFPQFSPIFASLGSVNLTSDRQSCDSLTRVSIPLQMVRSTNSYFIKFENPSQWVHIAEVRFSNQSVLTTMATTTREPTTTPDDSSSTITSSSSSEITSSPPPTSDMVTTRGFTPLSTSVATVTSLSTSNMVTTPTTTQDIPTTTPPASDTEDTTATSPTTTQDMQMTLDTDIEDTTTTPPTSSPTTSQPFFTDTTDESFAQSFPVAIVGGVVGVVVVLVILLILVVVVVLGCFVGRKRQSYRTEVEHLQDVMLERSNTNGVEDSMKLSSLKADDNSHYQKTQFDTTIQSQSPPAIGSVMITDTGAQYSNLKGNATQHETSPGIDEAGYSDVAILSHCDEAAYDDVIRKEPCDDQYDTVAGCTEEKNRAESELQEQAAFDSVTPTTRQHAYSLVVKKDSPIVPPKTPELYRDLKMESKKAEAGEEFYAEVDENLKAGLLPTKEAPANSVQQESEAGDDDPAYYSTVKDATPTTPATTPTGGEFVGEQDDIYSEVHDDNKHHMTSGPLVVSNTNVDHLESNPIYDSTDELALDAQGEDIIYSNPGVEDPETKEDAGESIYDTVYSERIQPSMFVKSPERAREREKSGSLSESTERGEEEEEEVVYAPVYSLTASMTSNNLLVFKQENIRKMKTLGTGFFGKVLLADTVGLSRKDLKIFEDDDDKSKSVRVAVKMLRLNPSAVRREAFEKELKFMSRLDHPNVIRTLGACTVDTPPFIVMEYMQKGDLNQYLQDFDSIVPGSAPPNNLAISVGTLTYMSAQIANAMKYLASRNYIHRDLATRNCLVGEESRIKIADFGMSKSLYECHYYIIKGHAILPVRWMARECFYGRFSAKTDVWAYGVTMWEMFTLAKDLPYEDMDDSEVAMDGSKMDGNRQLLERPEDCPQEVYSVMRMCWESEPEDRATFDKLHKTLLCFHQSSF